MEDAASDVLGLSLDDDDDEVEESAVREPKALLFLRKELLFRCLRSELDCEGSFPKAKRKDDGQVGAVVQLAARLTRRVKNMEPKSSTVEYAERALLLLRLRVLLQSEDTPRRIFTSIIGTESVVLYVQDSLFS